MEARIPMREMIRDITFDVRFTGVRVARARLWLAARLIRLAAIVAGTGLEISTDFAGAAPGKVLRYPRRRAR